MSNSPLVDYVHLSPNYTPGKTHEIDTVTIHCVVGQCTAEALGNVFANPSRQGSSNYGVDKDGHKHYFLKTPGWDQIKTQAS